MRKSFVSRAVSLSGLVILFAACPQDPNKNFMTLDGGGATTGGGGSTGGGGTSGGPLPTTIPGSPLATYDTSPASFTFSMFDEPGNRAAHNDGTPPTITFDGADGSPSLGSLKVTAPFSGVNQYVDVQSPSFGANNLQNFAGKRLHVRVKVDPGSTFMGQVQPYVDTTTGFIFVGSAINVMPPGGEWHDYVVDLEAAVTRITGYDLTKVILYGVHIGTGGGGANATAVTFHVDSFSVDPPLAGAMDAAAEAAPDATADVANDAATDAASSN